LALFDSVFSYFSSLVQLCRVSSADV